MRLLLDEDSQEKALVKILISKGNDVITVNDCGLSGQDDITVFGKAVETQRVILTRNCDDFIEIADSGARHSGILLHYPNGQVQMSHDAIAKSIWNIENTIGDISNQVIAIDHWQFDV